MAPLPPKKIICAKLHATYEYQRGVLRGIKRFALGKPDWQVYLLNYEGGLLKELANLPSVDGVIGYFASNESTPDELKKILSLTRNCAVGVSSYDRTYPIPRVVSDSKAVGVMAAEYFIERGYKRFAFVGDRPPTPHSASIDRGAAFVNRLGQSGFSVDCLDLGTFYRNELSLVPPTAIFAFNDNTARQVIEILYRAGMGVPEEYAVLGADDDPFEREQSPVPLSSIILDPEKVGYEAARQLEGLMTAKVRPAPNITYIAPVRIQTRSSTDVFLSDDPVVLKALHIIRNEIAHIQTVDECAVMAGTSRRSLERRFRTVLGRGVYALMQEARIEYAKQLMIQTDLKLTDIAATAGFGDGRMLSVLFRRHTGETPSAFRERMQLSQMR